jgi:hypothetical protein
MNISLTIILYIAYKSTMQYKKKCFIIMTTGIAEFQYNKVETNLH